MLGLRHLPLKFRLPLIHGALWTLARARAHDWAKADSTDYIRRGPLIVSGLLNESLGIGQAGRLTVTALRDAGYDVTEHDLRPAFRRILRQDAAWPEEREADIGGLAGRRQGESGGVWFIHANPSEAIIALLAHAPAKWAATYRIGYWAWETTKAPKSWVFVAEYFHEIWVPSDFVRDALSRTFTGAGREDLVQRLRVMPHPVPPLPANSAHKREEARIRFGLAAPCEVLCLFDAKSSAVRKNPWGVIEAWQEAFPEAATEARLTIKIADVTQDTASAARLWDLVARRDDMRLVSEHFSDADMTAFIGAFDILVSLHRAEGFGLTLAEAMEQGVAVIATGFSGNLQFMTQDNSRLVPAALVPVKDPEGPYTGLDRDPQQMWAEPDLEAAAHALRDLVGSADLRNRLSSAARAAIAPLSEPWRQAALLDLPFNQFL
jgi:glycosyltransferase involved in cell wall biosynthesis